MDEIRSIEPEGAPVHARTLAPTPPRAASSLSDAFPPGASWRR